MTETRQPRLYLDLDGVLADFDARACEVLDGQCHYRYDFIHGGDALWARLNAVPDFFLSFGPMADAHVLWAAVSHLNPVILTATPKSNPEEVARQKRAWVAKHLGPQVAVITCGSKDKPKFCRPGDVLVDDRSINKAEWEQRGGHSILHTRAIFTIASLKRLGILT